MKSIKQQYIDLMEGRMSQYNFMRSLRMSLPQYITNVTSFKDSVKILKNKGILNESDINELSPQTRYNAAIKAIDKSKNASRDNNSADYRKAVNQGNKFVTQIDPEVKNVVNGFAKSLGLEARIEKGIIDSTYEPSITIKIGPTSSKPEIVVFITKNSNKIEGGLPNEAAERRLGNIIKQIQQKELNVELNTNLNEAMGGDPIEATLKSYLAKGYSYAEAIELTAAEQGMDEEVLMSQYPQDAVDTEGYEDEGDDEEFIDMIARAEEEEAGKYTKNYDFPGGLGEKAHDGLKIEWDWDNADVDYDTDEEGNEGAFGTVFGRDEKDHAYSARFDAPVSGGDIDFDSADVSSIKKTEDASELYERSYKVSPNAISVSSLKKGDVLGGSGLEVINISAGARTPSGKIEVTVKDPKTGNEVTKVWNKATKVTVKKDLNEGKKKKEPKKELHPNQIHPQELRMGIKVELEHTDDLDKAKKIALDHLAENPFYYTALKLSGIESPSAPKAKAPKSAKKEKAAEAELVDKENAMKPVKGFEKAKASSNKAKKETNSGVKGVSELTHNAQSVRGLQKFATTGGKMKTVKSIYEAKFNAMPGEKPNATVQRAMGFIQSNPVLRQISDLITLQNDGENAILRYDYYKALPDEAYNKLELQFFVEDDFEGSDEDGGDDFETSGGTQSKIAYILYPKKKSGNLGTSLEMGASKASKMDAFKESLELLVREVLDEMYDGRDNLDEDGGFEQWKQALYKIVMEKAKLKADEIAIDDAEIKQYYQKGKTPEEVYFDIWQQDAGNFFSIPF